MTRRVPLRLSLTRDEALALLHCLRALAATLDPQGAGAELARVVTRAAEQLRCTLGLARDGGTR